MDRWAEIAIDPDIRKASTLPGWFYSDEGVYRAVRERVFSRSWQMAGDLDAVKVAGQVHPFLWLEGLVDEPLVLVRDRDDRLHCLSNVCTHRGTLVCEGDGVPGPHLRCRYHGRKFHLDGRFHSMPEFEDALAFPSPGDDLPRAAFGSWTRFAFAGIAPLLAFDEWIAPMRERCGTLPMGAAALDPARSRDYLVRANWALYVDNYLEGFHIPYVHAGLAGALDYGAYRTECFPASILQLGIAADGEPAFEPGPPSVAAYYWWLFPNTMFNFYPWGVSINIVTPLAVDRTRVRFLSYVWDAAKLDHGAGAGLDRVEREDEVIVESVQRGARSLLARRGRYSPAREQGVHHFHRLLTEALRQTSV